MTRTVGRIDSRSPPVWESWRQDPGKAIRVLPIRSAGRFRVVVIDSAAASGNRLHRSGEPTESGDFVQDDQQRRVARCHRRHETRPPNRVSNRLEPVLLLRNGRCNTGRPAADESGFQKTSSLRLKSWRVRPIVPSSFREPTGY